MRHAFLIIAHADYDILCTLIGMLDNSRCDIYIMVDKNHCYQRVYVQNMPDYLY